jgi:hypothetical protein
MNYYTWVFLRLGDMKAGGVDAGIVISVVKADDASILSTFHAATKMMSFLEYEIRPP